jgi:hypothetical protein
MANSLWTVPNIRRNAENVAENRFCAQEDLWTHSLGWLAIRFKPVSIDKTEPIYPLYVARLFYHYFYLKKCLKLETKLVGFSPDAMFLLEEFFKRAEEILEAENPSS